MTGDRADRAYGVRAWLLAGLFTAIFSVYGLGSSDVAHCDSATAALPVLQDVASRGDHGHGHTDLAGGSGDSGSPGHDHDPTGEVCLAIGLIAALFFIAARRGLPTHHVIVRRLRAPPLPQGRFVEPPCLHRLSILRC